MAIRTLGQYERLTTASKAMEWNVKDGLHPVHIGSIVAE
jgi:hypothetical protein